jgi:hypothetical protein
VKLRLDGFLASGSARRGVDGRGLSRRRAAHDLDLAGLRVLDEGDHHAEDTVLVVLPWVEQTAIHSRGADSARTRHGPLVSDTPRVDEIGAIIGRTKGFLLTERTARDAVDAVDALAEGARDAVDHAEGAGVSLIRDGDRTSVGATDAEVLEADTLQFTLGKAPA